MACRIVLIAWLGLTGGCAWLCPEPEPRTVVETVEVPTPYYVDPEPPPAWLTEPYHPDPLPVFISPEAEGATVALDEANAAALRALIRQLTGRLGAWRAWANPDTSPRRPIQ